MEWDQHETIEKVEAEDVGGTGPRRGRADADDEVFDGLAMDLSAPDQAVLVAVPNAQLTDQNLVPRREEIRFCLSRKGR